MEDGLTSRVKDGLQDHLEEKSPGRIARLPVLPHLYRTTTIISLSRLRIDFSPSYFLG